MPAENRSSNTREQLDALWRDIQDSALRSEDPPHVRFAAAILACPTPQPHPEPIAWMVGTAVWWTKEEAERDAAATGKTITPIGPMSCIAPADQHQGEPVARVEVGSDRNACVTVTDNDWLRELKDKAAHQVVALYTHSDPGEVERLRAELVKWKERCQYNADTAHDVARERDTLRAQLAEQDALLRELDDAWNSHDGKDRFGKLMQKVEALSASAEPSVPAAQPGKCLDGGDCGIGGTCKWCPHTTASPAQQPS